MGGALDLDPLLHCVGCPSHFCCVALGPGFTIGAFRGDYGSNSGFSCRQTENRSIDPRNTSIEQALNKSSKHFIPAD